MITCLGLNILLFVPHKTTAIVTYSFPEPYNWGDYLKSLLDLFERVAPNSTAGISSLNETKWTMGETDYFFHFEDFCRKPKNKPRTCFPIIELMSNQAMIVGDIARLLAESTAEGDTKSPYVDLWIEGIKSAEELSKAAISNLKSSNTSLTDGLVGKAIDIIESHGNQKKRPILVLLTNLLMIFLCVTLVLLPFWWEPISFFTGISGLMFPCMFLAAVAGHKGSSTVGILQIKGCKSLLAVFLVMLVFEIIGLFLSFIYLMYMDDRKEQGMSSA